MRPHAATAIGANYAYTYDANGNMLTRREGAIIHTHTWDAENRVKTISGNGHTVTYTYDADGQRVKKVEDGQTTVYIGNAYEKNVTANTVTTYYYAGGQRAAQRQGTTVSYFVGDNLGSTSLTTDATGAEVGRQKYFPFGVPRVQSGTLKTDFRFTGQRSEEVNFGSLYDYGARFYSPYLNRWIQPDTIVPDLRNPQSLNRYSYCLNNPLMFVDPTGHQAEIPGVPNPYDWTAQKLLGAPDSRRLPEESGLQSLTTDLGKKVVEAIDEVGRVMATGVEFLLGLFPGYDEVTAVVGRNITGDELSPEQRVVIGALGVAPLGDAGSISVKFSRRTLQHEFAGHAADFGVMGNANRKTLAQFENAIMSHITSSSTTVVSGTFRGTQKVIHYYDPVTRLWAALDETGKFVAGWRLSQDQLTYLERVGNVQ